MRNPLLYCLLAFIPLAVACASSTEGGGPTGGGPTEGLSEGLYHQPGEVDAINLELGEDGTFRWGIDGCDFAGGDAGRWERQDDAIVLMPHSGRDTFEWSHGPSFRNEIERLQVRPGEFEEEILVSGTIGGEPFEQRWKSGGLCPECGGALGPTGTRSCDDPYLGSADEADGDDSIEMDE